MQPPLGRREQDPEDIVPGADPVLPGDLPQQSVDRGRLSDTRR